MNWLLLTLLAIVARAVFSLGTRLLSREVKVSPVTQSFLLTFVSGLLSIIICPFIGGINFSGINQSLLPFILIIIASVFGNILFFKGQKQLDAGTTQIAFSSILIWGAILSTIFLNSKFSLLQVVGIILMIAAITLVQNRKKGVNINSSVLYIISSTLLFAVFQVTSASISSSISTGTYLILSYLGTALITFLIYFKTIKDDLKKLQLQIKNAFLKTFFASGTSLLYFIFSYLAYRHAPDRGVVVILLTAQVVLSVILGMLFLKEKDNKSRKLIAGVLAFIAGILIKS